MYPNGYEAKMRPEGCAIVVATLMDLDGAVIVSTDTDVAGTPTEVS
jgi:hypothetical protein